MRILIEEYQYAVEAVRSVLYGIDVLENVEGLVSVHYVGYYYNPQLRDCVFILPKVLLKDVDGQELVFGKYRPEAIAHLEQSPLNEVERNFLYKLSVWVYRAIVVFKNDRRNQTDIVYHMRIAQVGNGRRRLSNTFLDILLSLIQFNRDNRNFFFFVLKNLHSGYNKINWTRTIATKSAIVEKEGPVYLDIVNKRRQINFDEELIIIYYSILNYISDVYGFPLEVDCQFQLITGSRMQTYINGLGRRRLRQIKYKYFSDKALQLWQLCYAFFEQAKQVAVNISQKEYLLVKNFYIVFEAIIDELIGDNPLPDNMQKRQEDGKVVDHLFTARSLIDSERQQTYYIGDSKYYKMGHELTRESVFKQYTYARNVIQWNLDLWRNGNEPPSGIRLRDDVTEGYNIIPNFFVSARMDNGFDYINDGIEKTQRANNRFDKKQFDNRLFDRDTLLLFHYDVNFLFVLSLYARDNARQKAKWKEKVRSKFRTEIQQWLQEAYSFYAMRAKPSVNDVRFLSEHFKEVNGKVYTPFADEHTYSLALDRQPKFAEENEKLLTQLRDYFFIEPCPLGQDPDETLAPVVNTYDPEAIDSIANELVLIGSYKSQDHLNLIRQKKLYYVPIGDDPGSIRLVAGYDSVKFLILHRDNERQIYRLSGNPPKAYSKDALKGFGFTPHNGYYLGFELKSGMPITIPGLNHAVLRVWLNRCSYRPYFLTFKQLTDTNH